MTTNVFSRVIGGTAYDITTKSTVSPPRVFADDLVGCGDPTHLRFQQSGSYNALNLLTNVSETNPAGTPQCGTVPFLLFQASISGLVATANNLNPTSYLGALVNYMEEARAEWIGDLIADPPRVGNRLFVGNPSTFALIGDGDGRWVQLGDTYVYDSTLPSLSTPGNQIFQLSFPRIVERFDQCGRLLGHVVQANVAVQKIIPENRCVPSLDYQVSAKLFFATREIRVRYGMSSVGLNTALAATDFLMTLSVINNASNTEPDEGTISARNALGHHMGNYQEKVITF